MANDITGINTSRLQQANNRGKTQETRNEGPQKPSSTEANSSSAYQSDKVSLTETAARLKELENQLKNESPVDESRVNDVRAAMNSGKYYVDTTKVAQKMINLEKEFDV